MQDFLAERESQKYDPFLGNCLYASSSSPVVLYPTGKTLSRLGMSFLLVISYAEGPIEYRDIYKS